MLRPPLPLAAAASPPAGGAALDQVVVATVASLVLSVAVLGLIVGHRSGRLGWPERLAGFSARVSGMAGWAALPGAILAGSLVLAVFGMYWDVSLHIDEGRDPGPLANPAHYFILAGLFGVFGSGVAAIALPRGRPAASAVRLPNGWYAPLGGLLIALCGAVSLLAFPFDDLWHRLFGQDVTLWGPTHLLLIGGATFSIVGVWILVREGRTAMGPRAPVAPPLPPAGADVAIVGGLLVGLSTFQAEFDFGVPQFRLVLHPALLMLATGVVLVAARIRLGPGGALGAAAFALALRAAIAVLVGPLLGQSTPHFPLYLAEAGVVEAVALLVPTRRPVAYPLAAGAAMGTVGVAAEWGWSHVWGVLPWPPSLLPEALLAIPAAIAAATIGGFVARALSPHPVAARPPRWLVPAAVGAAVAVIAWGLPMPTGAHPPRATVDVRTLHNGPERTAAVQATIDPPAAARDARWLTITAWQGGGSVVDRLRRVAPGRFASTKPIPVHGDWKAVVRLQRGRAVLGVPIYLPRDPAIPAAEVRAQPHATRVFVADHRLLQREARRHVPVWLGALAYVGAAVLWTAMLTALAWGLVRLSRVRDDSAPAAPRPARPPPVPAGRPAAAR
jgi:hypothetical protein